MLTVKKDKKHFILVFTKLHNVNYVAIPHLCYSNYGLFQTCHIHSLHGKVLN